MPGLILATVTPDNTPGGAILTFAFPLGLFAVIIVVLYLWLGRPHRRVPAGLTSPVGTAAATDAPHPEVAHGASVAAGLPTAVGGGGAESAVEPAGGVRKAEDNGTSAPVTGAEGPPETGTGSAQAAAGPSDTATGSTQPSAGTSGSPDGTAEDSGAGPSGAATGTGNVSGQDTGPAGTGDPEHRTTDGTEASE